ncbi:DUF6191 domain-containing protein [Kitasatospora kifunensis]|uniref:Uncharacterized protein n=1 Tax=Kitasatospora kifunensis TaxID=58351 RepID=A0A7W7VYS4_KITKI|nr:DUF6191 domain-containing protein [Kitasatospora kifunensis]MBB4926999.1 hypothetical protein [Kitasatospora kifunensis]
MTPLLSGAGGSLLLPAALILLFFIGAAARYTLARLRGQPHAGRGVAALATEELHALCYPSKRVQLEQRRIELVLRDDEQAGAPKRTGIDLRAGTATLPPPGPDPGQPAGRAQ